MLPNQVLQKTMRDMGEIVGENCSIWNSEGVCLAHFASISEMDRREIQEVIQNMDEREKIKEAGKSFFCIYMEEELVYILVIHTEKEGTEVIGRLSVKQIETLIQAYQERMNRNHFMQNLLLDNMLLVDVYNRAKKLNVAIEERRAVIVIEPKNPEENLVLETLKGIYATSTRDFVTVVDEGHIILVKALEDGEGYKLNDVAKSIVDIVNTEAMVNVRVAYGTIVSEIREVSKSYKEAGMALDVGRIFYEEKNILAYNELGIGRLIHQLPVSLCEMFLKEVFAGKAVEQFDEETLSTVHKFFENNLNISETARQLFLHRNTLVYRLEKIQKKTGLDVRVFDDALTFKIALMVANHMKSLQTPEDKATMYTN